MITHIQSTTILSKLSLGTGLAIALLMILSLSIQAANFDLTGDCSGGVGDISALKAAITSANANAQADTITLAEDCVYSLTSVEESDPDGYISTHVSVEISTVDDSIRVLDIPGFLTRKTDTDMNVRQGETMVISGLVNTDSAKAVDKLPGLGNIPILGELFKSRSFKNNETEMVILVTPHIIDPEHKINKQWIKRAGELRQQSSEDLEFKLLD